MSAIDIPLALHYLVPNAKYEGRPETQDDYESAKWFRWNDARPKPSWADVTAVWPSAEADFRAPKEDIVDRIAKLEQDVLTARAGMVMK